MVMVEFSMFPVDKGESLSKYVARILKVIEQSKISYCINPMGTVMEGEWDEVMELIKRCHQELEKDCNRISTSIKIDYRKGNAPRMNAKIRSVEEKIGKSLRKG
ncbi:MAG: thiamine-binding protein [Deltaproteobacteria bacterium]|nr:MAG: thiamine-binding protein [Deltaproteobacteria bacterium]